METLTTSVNDLRHKKMSWPYFREIGKQVLFGSALFDLVAAWMFLAICLVVGILPTHEKIWSLILPVMATISIVVLVVSAFASCHMESMEKMKQFTAALKRAALNLAIVPIAWRKLVWLFRCCGVH